MAENLREAERELVLELPLLASLSAAERARFLEDLRVRSWPAGGRVVREGEESTALFVVLAGSVRVTTRVGAQDLQLAELGPQSVFGEEGLLTSGPRSATVTAVTALRCGVVPAATFERLLDRSADARRGLEELSARRLRERLGRSVAALRDLDLEGTRTGEVTRRVFQAGETLLEEGAPSRAVYFLLRGVAVALQGGGGAPTTLSRVGPGQCVGELGVLKDQPRGASVLAETEVHALRVEAPRFRAWVAENPALADLLGTLERVYPLADGRLLSVYRSKHDGREAVTTLAGDPAGDCVLSTKLLGANVVVLARGAAELDGDTRVVTFSDPDGRRSRELVLDQITLDPRGEITAGRMAGVEIHVVGPDVSRLYHGLRDREVLDRKALNRFRRTGYPGGDTTAQDPSRVCNCLGIGRAEVAAAVAEHGPELDMVTLALGAGAVCGACLPTLADLVSGGRAASVGSVPNTVPPRASSRLVARHPEIRFDLQALRALRDRPELHAVAVASVFAAVGERFMIRRIGQVLPSLRDPSLVADVEVFLEQEGHHVAAHEPLNQLLVEQVVPTCGALRRASRRMVGGVERLSPSIALAVCAAFEYVADCTFDLYLRTYYASGRRYSPEPEVHDLVERSGAGLLLRWHGGEELLHRHVAFDVLSAQGAGLLTRWMGFGILGLQAVLLLIPALLGLRACTQRTAPPPARAATIGNLRLVMRTAAASLRFLLPGFHPGQTRLPYLEDLAEELARIPEA